MRVAQAMAGSLLAMRLVFKPVSEALVRSTTWFEKRYQKRAAHSISMDALGHALELTKDASTTAEEQRILRGIVKFGNIEVKQVMRPRTEVVAFDRDLSFKQLLAAIVDSGFSRVPVYEETMDRVVGMLYIKDVLPHIHSSDFDWHTLLREPYFVPENKKLEWWLIGLTTLGIVSMLAPGLVVWAKFVNVPDEAAEVEVVSQQWHWSYRFPGKDGVLGTVNSRFVDDTNPFGMNPDDPHGKDDVLVASQEVHLPIGKPVKMLLRSKDVLHNFAIAEMRVKMDMVPGMVPYMWFTPTRTGKFDVLCQELCGTGHFTMRGRLVVEDEGAFGTWLAGHPTYAQTSARVAGDAETGKALYAACGACHGAAGEGNAALHAPRPVSYTHLTLPTSALV